MGRILLQNLSVSYPAKRADVPALSSLSASFENGSLNVILGKSGCGKTTLLRCLLGKIPYEGSILFDGMDVSKLPLEKRSIAYVSQEYGLYPHFTVFENIAFPLKLLGAPRKEIEERVDAVADELGLTACLSRKPRYLSGGQQQRAAIARALVKEPEVILFDEPLSNLDAPKRSEIVALLKKRFQANHPTVVYVTHNYYEALNLGDHIFVLDQGKIVFEGNPDQTQDSMNPLLSEIRSASL